MTAPTSTGTAKRIHIIAIGGTGVAPLACLLKEEGYQVQGSDEPLYPPMSHLLERYGIRPFEGYDPAHLHPRPDLVIVGNVVARTNPEVEELERLGWPKLSMPEALSRFFLASRRPIVVAGTHGKTTTTSLAAWVYDQCGEDPGYLVGGLPRDLPASFARGTGRRFIVEGDEYNAAYFDRGPKFLHYRPQTLILTGVEHDHVDLYPQRESFLAAFRSLVEALPADGALIADGDSQEVRELARWARCPIVFYGLGEANAVRPLEGVHASPDGTLFRVRDEALAEEVELAISLPGEHNVRNALAVWILARRDGLPAPAIRQALQRFRGAHRRLETVAESAGVTVVDDFAHHPTEIGTTLRALRQRYPRRRLVAVFEPRSLTSGRSFLFDSYVQALVHAEVVHLAPIFHAARLRDEERLDLCRLASELRRRDVEAHAWEDNEALLGGLVEAATPGDVAVFMSSGSFADLPRRLAERLRAEGLAAGSREDGPEPEPEAAEPRPRP